MLFSRIFAAYLVTMKFTLQAQDKLSSARAGLLETAHGPIETPIFMPVGTAGTVKAVHQHELVKDMAYTRQMP